jgi:hypothetical protein
MLASKEQLQVIESFIWSRCPIAPQSYGNLTPFIVRNDNSCKVHAEGSMLIKSLWSSDNWGSTPSSNGKKLHLSSSYGTVTAKRMCWPHHLQYQHQHQTHVNYNPKINTPHGPIGCWTWYFRAILSWYYRVVSQKPTCGHYCLTVKQVQCTTCIVFKDIFGLARCVSQLKYFY